jgi:hypothetical protein
MGAILQWCPHSFIITDSWEHIYGSRKGTAVQTAISHFPESRQARSTPVPA